jgi:hypothetical protein
MDNPKGHEQNADRIAWWNGLGGQRRRAGSRCGTGCWRRCGHPDRAKPKTGEHIVDVGCGSGITQSRSRYKRLDEFGCADCQERKMRPMIG